MAQPRNTRLYEDVMLLALRDEKGTIAAGSMYQYALAGAFVAELMMTERIAMESGRRKLVDVVDASSTGDELLDECLEKMAGAKRRAPINT